MALSASATESFSSFSSIRGAAAQARGVVDAEAPAAPVEIDGDRVARDAGLRAGQQPILAEQAVDQRRLAGVRPSDDRDADRARVGVVGSFDRPRALGARGRGLLGQRRAQRVVEIGQPLAVLGGDRRPARRARAHRLRARPLAGPAFALVGDDDRGLARPAHQIGEGAVGRRRAGAGIDQEEDRIGLRDRRLGLRPHAAGEAFGRRLLEARGVDDGEGEIAEPRRALAAVARDAGLVVDQRQPPADQPVEQRRLADIRPADDGDGEAHGPTVRCAVRALCRADAAQMQVTRTPRSASRRLQLRRLAAG